MKIGNINFIEYKPGIEIKPGHYYTGIPNEIYHKLDGSYSKSSLDLLEKDPLKLFKRKEKQQTRAMQIGSAIHCAILEPEKFRNQYLLMPEIKDRRQPEYKNAIKYYGESNVFTSTDCENISGIINAVRNNEYALELLNAPGPTEVSGFFIDNETGLLLRHRFDKLSYINGEWIGVDLKKTRESNEFKFSKSIFEYNYHLQDAVYSTGFKEITGEKLRSFTFIAVEEEYPNIVELYELCDISKNIGIQLMRELIDDLNNYLIGKKVAHNNRSKKLISLPEFAMKEFNQDIF